MGSNRTDPPFLLKYLLMLALQFPVWMSAGVLWAVLMAWAFGHNPAGAFVGGVGWGFFMWLLCGNLIAVGAAWRREAEFPAPDRAAFLAALSKAAGKVGF